MTRIVCQQLAPRIADLQANRRLSLSAISDAVSAGADVVVLPELVTSGYVFESAEEAASVAIAPEDPLFAEWAAEAGSAVVIGRDRRVPQGPPVGPREAVVRARR
jgi:predicted amidohydrolase